jgi:alanyl-tRNA synthetase
MYCSTAGAPAEDATPPARASGTERLYYTDAYLRSFRGRVAAIMPPEGQRPGGVVLDRTAFYPTSGGQPHDTGMLAGRPVVDVVDAGDAVVHVLGRDGAEDLAVGAEVEGTIDWDRRLDHMQQHTAQHVLSAVFLDVLGAETVSVHMGDASTLDLEIQSLSPDDARRVEDAAARIVFDDRPVTVRFVEASEAEAAGLRRPPRRTGTLRIVEIAGCDRSACGGTHVRHTGEVGLVLLRRWERTRGRIRVGFLAGWRALRDYRWKHAFVSEWSARLTVGDRELGDALARLAREAEERERLLVDARRRLVAYEAAERLAHGASDDPGVATHGAVEQTADAPRPGGPAARVFRLDFPRRDLDDVRLLLKEMTSREPCVVLAGVLEQGRLCFARSPGAGPDMAAVLARACRAVGGRGGGTAEFAQGATPPGEAVARALALAEQEVRGA